MQLRLLAVRHRAAPDVAGNELLGPEVGAAARGVDHLFFVVIYAGCPLVFFLLSTTRGCTQGWGWPSFVLIIFLSSENPNPAEVPRALIATRCGASRLCCGW